jgi:hypothetical protein
MKALLATAIFAFSTVSFGQNFDAAATDDRSEETQFEENAADEPLARVQCIAVDDANQQFKAVRRKLKNAQNAALAKCKKAGGINCRIKVCKNVTFSL